MPRKPTEKVVEHRITLGDFERGQLKNVVKAEAFKDYGQLMQGAGLVGVGAGAALAAIVFFRYKTPDVFNWIKETASNPIKDFSSWAFGSYGETGLFEDAIGETMKNNIFADRREAQRLAAVRGSIANQITVFCSPSSEKYDEQICTNLNVHIKRKFFAELQAFNDDIEVRYSSPTYTEENAFKYRNFIYKGLGDIDPYKRAGSTQMTRPKPIPPVVPNVPESDPEFIGPLLPDDWKN